MTGMLCATILTSCGRTPSNPDATSGDQAQEETAEVTLVEEHTSGESGGTQDAATQDANPQPEASEEAAPAPETSVPALQSDANIEVVGYAPYEGASASLFLNEGDRIAVISPSSLPSADQVDATMEGLRAWGYEPVQGSYVLTYDRTLDNCLEDLTWALNDPDIKAIFCVRGGYGASELMDALTLDLIRSSNKLIIGYSDISIFHAAWTCAGLPSVHASMSAAFTELPEECGEVERRMLRGEVPTYLCRGTSYDHAGSAEGVLIGGNLSTVTAILNTAYDCTRMGKPYVLFLEELQEDMQHIHRFLAILDHAGVLDNAAGIILGEWEQIPEDTGAYGGDSRGGYFASVDDMVYRQFFSDRDIPVAYGFPAGHGWQNYPLLMGEEIRLTVTDGTYMLEWV